MKRSIILHALRWAGFLPSAIAAFVGTCALTVIIIKFLAAASGASGLGDLLGSTVPYCIGAAAFVSAGTMVAPAGRRHVAVLMSGLYLILSVIVVAVTLRTPDKTRVPWFDVGALVLLGSASAISVTVAFLREDAAKKRAHLTSIQTRCLRAKEYHWVRRRVPSEQYAEICKHLIRLSGCETAHALYLP